MRGSACFVFVLVACLLTGASASGQTVGLPDLQTTVSDPIGTVTSTTDAVVGTLGSAVDQATGSSPGSTAMGVVSTVTSGSGSSSGSDGSTGGSTASSSGSTTSSSGQSSAPSRRSGSAAGSSRPQIKTRFDRLPRRFETLLERIELGQNIRANLRRLERALASASPELRQRVLRLIRAEIARLQRGGTTARERRRIERLRFALETLTRASAPAPELSPTSGVAGSEPVAPGEQAGTSRGVAGQKSGVLETHAGGGNERPQTRPLLPPSGDQVPFLLGVLALAALVLGFVGLVAGVTKHVLRSG